MRLGHVIYIVHDLDKAVKEWQDKGFTVEYGRNKKPVNALIYFSDGPYVELMCGGGMNAFSKKFMRLIGKADFMNRFDYWDLAPEGWTSLCIEKDPGGLENEIAYLDSVGIKGTYMKNLKRTDTKNRELKYKCFFTHDFHMPFLMSYFQANDPKPKNYVHPNGIKGISRVVYNTSEKNARALEHLVSDERLQVNIADKTSIVSVDFYK